MTIRQWTMGMQRNLRRQTAYRCAVRQEKWSDMPIARRPLILSYYFSSLFSKHSSTPRQCANSAHHSSLPKYKRDPFLEHTQPSIPPTDTEQNQVYQTVFNPSSDLLKASSIPPPIKIVIPATWRIGNTKSGPTHLLGELSVPQTNDLHVLGCLGSQIRVRGLDGLEHSSDLAGARVNLH